MKKNLVCCIPKCFSLTAGEAASPVQTTFHLPMSMIICSILIVSFFMLLIVSVGNDGYFFVAALMFVYVVIIELLDKYRRLAIS